MSSSMRALRGALGVPVSLLVLSTLRVGAAADAGPAADVPEEPPCVLARAVAPPRYPGYDHIVRLHNRCDRPVQCDVSSDVRPEPVATLVPAQSDVDVVLWKGSPARVFTAKVECRWAGLSARPHPS